MQVISVGDCQLGGSRDVPIRYGGGTDLAPYGTPCSTYNHPNNFEINHTETEKYESYETAVV